MTEPSIVVITNGTYFARLILDGVFERWSPCIKGVLVITGDYKGRTGLRALWELSKVTALPYIIYKTTVYLFFKLASWLKPSFTFSVQAKSTSYGIPIKELPSVKCEEAITWIQSQQPDLIVSVSCPQMIGKRILSCARLGGINIHSSLLPKYAGLAPYYWVLSQGEIESGITAHYMTLKFDEGNILAQSKATVSEGESAFHLFTRLSSIGACTLVDAIQAALNGDLGRKQDLSQYTYFSNPTPISYKSLKSNGHSLIKLNELIAIIIENNNQPTKLTPEARTENMQV
jgi:folate-dependent phosphoribosylglycinamide formyltransferase PurN